MSVLLPVVLLTEASGICVHTEVQACWFSKVFFMGIASHRHNRESNTHAHGTPRETRTRHTRDVTPCATCTGLRSGGGRTRTNKKIKLKSVRLYYYFSGFIHTNKENDEACCASAGAAAWHPPSMERCTRERSGFLSLHARGRMKHVDRRTYTLLYICSITVTESLQRVL